MPHQIDFYYDFASPNAYLVEAVLPQIAAQHAATIRRVPVLVGGMFKEAGNTPPMVRYQNVPSKIAYLGVEIERFVKKYSVPFAWTPHFPILSTALMRGAIYAEGQPWDALYRDTIYRHAWVEKTNMMDPAAVQAALEAAGLPAKDILAATQDPNVKARLFETTSAAVARGAFGVPTLFVGEEMFFGKDALPALIDMLDT